MGVSRAARKGFVTIFQLASAELSFGIFLMYVLIFNCLLFFYGIFLFFNLIFSFKWYLIIKLPHCLLRSATFLDGSSPRIILVFSSRFFWGVGFFLLSGIGHQLLFPGTVGRRRSLPSVRSVPVS